MGSFLSAPNKDIEYDVGEGNGVKYACGSVQGWRKTQEDAHVACAKLSMVYEGSEDMKNGQKLVEGSTNGFLLTAADKEAVSAAADAIQREFKARLESMSAFGVFDGHGGKEVARFVAGHILEELVQSAMFRQCAVEPALVQLFHRLDDLLVDPRNQDKLTALRSIKNPSDVAKQRQQSAWAMASIDSANAEANGNKGELVTRDDSDPSPRAGAANGGAAGGDNVRMFLRRLLKSRRNVVGGKSAEIERALERLDMKEGQQNAAAGGNNSNDSTDNGEGGENSGDGATSAGSNDNDQCAGNGMVQFATEEEEEEDEEDDGEIGKGDEAQVTRISREGLFGPSNGDDDEEEENRGSDSSEASDSASAGEMAIVAVPDENELEEHPTVTDGCASIRTVPISSVSQRSVSGAQSCLLPSHQLVAGCTAVFALLDHAAQKLFVANAGDSRAVLCRNGEAISLTKDHKPNDATELSRIEAAGGFVSAVGRVNNNLNLSRAIGDLKYKQIKGLSGREQLISAEPDVTVVDVDPVEDEFMVLACDGVWDVMTNQNICDFVRERLVNGCKPKEKSNVGANVEAATEEDGDSVNKNASESDECSSQSSAATTSATDDSSSSSETAAVAPSTFTDASSGSSSSSSGHTIDLEAIIADVFDYCIADNIGDCSLGSDNMTLIIVIFDEFKRRVERKDSSIVLRQQTAPSPVGEDDESNAAVAAAASAAEGGNDSDEAKDSSDEQPEVGVD